MIRSFRIMVGTVKAYVIMSAVIVGAAAVLGAVNKLIDLDWLNAFLSEAFPTISVIMLATCSIVVVLGVFNTNNPEGGGYKYYHSLPNSAVHFQNAVFFANVLTAVMTAAYMAVAAVFFGAETALFAAGVSLFSVGLMNFLGYTKSPLSKMIPLCIAGGMAGAFASGFAAGFADGAEIEVSLRVFAVIGAMILAFYLAGAVYAVLKARTAWRREI